MIRASYLLICAGAIFLFWGIAGSSLTFRLAGEALLFLGLGLLVGSVSQRIRRH